MAEDQAAGQQQSQQPAFSIEKIYVKDLSLEVPNAPAVFTLREAPQVGIELSNSASRLDENFFEVAITATVTSKVEDKTIFLVEVAQAGIFQLRGIPEQDLEPILGIACPNILFPYLRETVSDVVSRAGFPPVFLSPVNFEALYVQQKQHQQVAPAGDASH